MRRADLSRSKPYAARPCSPHRSADTNSMSLALARFSSEDHGRTAKAHHDDETRRLIGELCETSVAAGAGEAPTIAALNVEQALLRHLGLAST